MCECRFLVCIWKEEKIYRNARSNVYVHFLMTGKEKKKTLCSLLHSNFTDFLKAFFSLWADFNGSPTATNLEKKTLHSLPWNHLVCERKTWETIFSLVKAARHFLALLLESRLNTFLNCLVHVNIPLAISVTTYERPTSAPDHRWDMVREVGIESHWKVCTVGLSC